MSKQASTKLQPDSTNVVPLRKLASMPTDPRPDHPHSNKGQIVQGLRDLLAQAERGDFDGGLAFLGTRRGAGFSLYMMGDLVHDLTETTFVFNRANMKLAEMARDERRKRAGRG